MQKKYKAFTLSNAPIAAISRWKKVLFASLICRPLFYYLFKNDAE